MKPARASPDRRGLTVIVDMLGALLVWNWESGIKGSDIHGFPDALFVATVQVLTVSSSLTNPLTGVDGPVGARKERFATNEALFRAATERVAEVASRYEVETHTFGVVPQHEQPEVETVIERRPSYFVVEKREQDAQEVARETDPRA